MTEADKAPWGSCLDTKEQPSHQVGISDVKKTGAVTRECDRVGPACAREGSGESSEEEALG